MKNHQKRISASRYWKFARKTTKYIAKQNPGAHSSEMGFSLVMVLREMLGMAKIRKEARDILLHKDVLVDGVKRKDHRFCVGFMDVISFPQIKKSYRIIMEKNGKLGIIEIDEKEAQIKVLKIKNKCAMKGKKIQMTLFDGRSIIVEKSDCNVGDSLLIEVPSHKVKEHFKFEKNASIILLGGKHIGIKGIIENVEGDKLIFKNEKGEILETKKEHAYVLGREKTALKVQ